MVGMKGTLIIGLDRNVAKCQQLAWGHGVKSERREQGERGIDGSERNGAGYPRQTLAGPKNEMGRRRHAARRLARGRAGTFIRLSSQVKQSRGAVP